MWGDVLRQVDRFLIFGRRTCQTSKTRKGILRQRSDLGHPVVKVLTDAGKSGRCSMRARIANIGVSGVRNSWLKIARN